MKRVFIYGGCTSRDAVDFYPEFGLALHSYIARQSLISAFAPASLQYFDTRSVTRSFQRRMLRGDITSSMPDHIRSHATEIDLIIWDLMIERVGVREVRTGGFVTRNGTPLTSTAPDDILGKSLMFGSEEHFNQWSVALDAFVSLLRDTALLQRTVINATPWATKTQSGEPAISESSMTPEWFNTNIARYWQAAADRGIKIANVSSSEAVADPDHRWGPAYFHYVDATYRTQLQRLQELE